MGWITWVGMRGAGLRVLSTLSAVEVTNCHFEKEERFLRGLRDGSGSDGCGTLFRFCGMVLFLD